jgi:hypothetical protein
VPHQADKFPLADRQLNVIEGNVFASPRQGKATINVVNFKKDGHGG